MNDFNSVMQTIKYWYCTIKRFFDKVLVANRQRFGKQLNSVSQRPKDVLGRAGEEAAARFLEKKGYSILHRNIRLGNGEIDIVARIGATLVIAEVKTRRHSSIKPPYEYVEVKKRRRIVKMVEKFIGTSANNAIRYDILSVTLAMDETFEIEHLENAFSAGKNRIPAAAKEARQAVLRQVQPLW